MTPPASPSAAHQRQFCLESLHTECKLYDAESAKEMRDGELTDVAIEPHKQTREFCWLLLGFIILALVMGIWFLGTAPKMPQPGLTVPDNSGATQAGTTFELSKATGDFRIFPNTSAHTTGSLWVNLVLINPFKPTTESIVSPMAAYAINADRITTRTLAMVQGVCLDAIWAHNDLPADHLFPSGEWEVLPHTPPNL